MIRTLFGWVLGMAFAVALIVGSLGLPRNAEAAGGCPECIAAIQAAREFLDSQLQNAATYINDFAEKLADFTIENDWIRERMHAAEEKALSDRELEAQVRIAEAQSNVDADLARKQRIYDSYNERQVPAGACFAATVGNQVGTMMQGVDQVRDGISKAMTDWSGAKKGAASNKGPAAAASSLADGVAIAGGKGIRATDAGTFFNTDTLSDDQVKAAIVRIKLITDPAPPFASPDDMSQGYDIAQRLSREAAMSMGQAPMIDQVARRAGTNPGMVEFVKRARSALGGVDFGRLVSPTAKIDTAVSWNEMMRVESERRFGNLGWYTQTIQAGNDHQRQIEALHIDALRVYLDWKRYEKEEQISGLLGAILTIMANRRYESTDQSTGQADQVGRSVGAGVLAVAPANPTATTAESR